MAMTLKYLSRTNIIKHDVAARLIGPPPTKSFWFE